MDRKTTPEPLTPAEAKEQLREVAARVGIVPWVRRDPFGAMITGAVVGFLLGRLPRVLRQVTHSRVGQKVIDRLV